MFQKKPHIPLTIVFIRLAGSCQKLSLLRSSSMRSKGHPVTHLLFESRSRLENNSPFAKRFQCIFTFFRKIHRSFKTFRGFLYKFTTLHFFYLDFVLVFQLSTKCPFSSAAIFLLYSNSSVYLLSYLIRCPNYVIET